MLIPGDHHPTHHRGTGAGAGDYTAAGVDSADRFEQPGIKQRRRQLALITPGKEDPRGLRHPTQIYFLIGIFPRAVDDIDMRDAER
jgi:hypothetical protein